MPDILQRFQCLGCHRQVVDFDAPASCSCPAEASWRAVPIVRQAHITTGMAVEFVYDSIDSIDEAVAESAEEESLNQEFKRLEKARREEQS